MRRLWTATIGLLALLATVAPRPAAAAEIPGLVAYANDSVRASDRVVLCAVTLALARADGGETVEFQLLASADRFGFKLTAGAFDPATGGLEPYQLEDADFGGPRFAYERAFGKRLTLTGQVVGMLGQMLIAQDYLDAFFGGRFVLAFRRQGRDAESRYLVPDAPGRAVREGFTACLRQLRPG